MKQLTVIFFLFILSSLNMFAQEIEHHHDIHYSFIENKGQWNPKILFQSKFNGGNLWIQQNKFLFHFQDFSLMHDMHAGGKPNKNSKIAQTVVHLNFIGSNEVNEIQKVNPTESYYNYFLGNDSTKWASDVHGYSEATMSNLYDGIDLKIIENKKDLKYEFHVQPNADPSKIKLEYVGQKSIEIDKDGNLVAQTDLGRIIEKKPYTYQIINGKISVVKNEFKLEGNKVVFDLGSFNPEYELIIDPVLVFATYSGSHSDNFGMTATYAHDGCAYSGGTVFGNKYPAPDNGAYDITSSFSVTNNGNGAGYGITDVFISKYSADGAHMLWTNFIGGGNSTSGTETVHSLIADKQNNLYFFGATSSIDFPIVNGFQVHHAGGTPYFDFMNNGVFFQNTGTDIYIAKLSENGHQLLGSTYLGGSSNDGVNTIDRNLQYLDASYQNVHYNVYGTTYDSITPNYGDQFRGEIMLDKNNNVLVASCTRSTNFPVINAIQSNNGGKQDGVIFKLNNSLSNLLFSTYFGGNESDACYSVKIDSNFNLIYGGGTISHNLPTSLGVIHTTYYGGKTDGFVGKIDDVSNTLIACSYIGTTKEDQVYFVESNRNNEIFLFGQSIGGTFPIINVGYSNPNSNQFIAKLNPQITSVINSTLFGNGDINSLASPSAFLVDLCGNIYTSSWGGNIFGSAMNGMPIVSNDNLYQSSNGFDFYLFVLDRNFNQIIYASYIGGNQSQEHVDGGTSRFDKNGVVYQSVCGGCGIFGDGYSDFPTTQNAYSKFNLDSAGCNNLVFKFDFGIIPKAEFIPDQTIGCVDFAVKLNNTSTASDTYLWDFGNGVTSSVNFDTTIIYTQPGVYQVYLYVTDSICQLTDTAHITINVYDSLQLSVDNDTTFCLPIPLIFTANSNGTANSFVWSSNSNFSDTLNTSISDSILSFTADYSGYYYVKVGNGGCNLKDSIKVEVISSDITLSGNSQLCVLDTAQITATNSNPAINFTYLWSPDSIILSPLTINSATIYALSSQYVYLDISDGNSCSFTDSIFIDVIKIYPNTITASASDYLVPEGATVQLYGQPSGLIYNWSPSGGLNNPNIQNPDATVNGETVFVLAAGFENCMKMDTIVIKTYPFNCEDPFVFIPTAFSPNGDNENDVLYVRGEMIKEMTFRVFDRWGELIFESHDLHTGWDGKFKGKKLDPDVYDYYLEVTCIDDQTNIKKGNITLLK